MKKFLVGVSAVAVAAATVPMFAAFEAHIINVTAKIENALTVDTRPMEFGTVFPQERLDRQVTVALSDSFQGAERMEYANYVIRQKPKCGKAVAESKPVTYSEFAQATENQAGAFICPEGFTQLPVLCPYLSKHDADPADENDDAGFNAFHGMPEPWTMAATLATEVKGRLDKTTQDPSDLWTIDLRVPCFAGACAQDWDDFVRRESGNPQIEPSLYIQPAAREHELFGCDLWIEVKGFEAPPATCVPSEEVCDGRDNDCDGQTDEGWTLGEACGTGQGQCAASGVTVCDASNPSGEPVCSVSAGAPTTEVCTDGLDNDCDGAVDCSDSDCAGNNACPVTATLENKDTGGDWSVIVDGTSGSLTYKPSGPTFDYSFTAQGLTAGTSYSLIYYGDGWPGNHPGALLGQGTTNGSGALALSGNSDIGMSLPDSADANFASGKAKVWLVPSSSYTVASHSVTTWNPATFLFDATNADLVTYQRTVAAPTTISLLNIGAASQYGYVHDYSTASAQFTYQTPASGQLSGTFTATGLKPLMTYQLKFNGKPTCQDAGGDDVLNEKLGYMGRWWDNTTNANVSDADYLANSVYHGGTHCISGYLVWGFVTADASGSVTKAVTTDSSYHVLWCSGGSCGTSNNSQLATGLDPVHPTLPLCAAANVTGQIERSSCGGTTFTAGTYQLGMVLNEESFHQSSFGTWTAVMDGDITFTIN
ncbi:MAG: putative metal-binding motif-containing protein [Patescibacteria group bacterium]|nr:putative metal-binding motif-containing protein [Patescibacteria group bacterium]